MGRTGILGVSAMVAGLALPVEIPGQSFEGFVKQRQVTVSEDGLLALLYSAREIEALDEPPEIDAQRVFDLPLDRILALADTAGEEAADVQELLYTVAKDRLRVDGATGSGESGHIIIDFESGTYRIVHPAEKAFIEVSGDDLVRMKELYGAVPEAEAKEEQATSIKVRALGKSKAIAGMRCDAYELRSEDEITVVWVSADLKDLANAFADFMERMQALGMGEGEEKDIEVLKLVREHGFPVLEQTVRQYAPYGSTEYEISEVLSIERKAPPATLFDVPKDYEKRSLTDMIRRN